MGLNGTRNNGISGTREYVVWTNIKYRCSGEKHGSYKNYGARGIKVCDRWLESFQNFKDDMGCCPSPSHSIDRIDNNGDYESSNCRWATRSEQDNNRQRTIRLTYKGETKSIHEWSLETGIRHKLIYGRIFEHGWSVEEGLTTPLHKGRKHNITPEGG